jgi:hypothetical protein
MCTCTQLLAPQAVSPRASLRAGIMEVSPALLILLAIVVLVLLVRHVLRSGLLHPVKVEEAVTLGPYLVLHSDHVVR